MADTLTRSPLWDPSFEHDACGIGALASLAGRKSHQMVDDALSVLVNLEHRGGAGLERNSGDGAGILIQVPHRFFRKEAQKEGALLPAEGDYGVAMLFLPQDPFGVEAARRVFEQGCAACGVPLLFWREVPVDPHDLGDSALAGMPTIYQAFLGRPEGVGLGDDFERALYVCRRTIEKAAEEDPALEDRIFYVCSMSSRTIVYKGMLLATQMRRFYLDLNDAAVESALCLVHSRYSTNTTPSWERAHPNRYLIHNGEINTLKGNVGWIRAREPEFYSPVLGPKLADVLPVINREGSDSAILDNVLEFLVMNGRTMSRAASLLIPEPWEKNPHLPEKRRAYDEYQSMLMEPWDGPAAIAYTDGRTLGASLDRNGLRPARYYVTHDDRFLLASEVGVLDVDPADILQAGELGPGEMLLVDPSQARVIWNDELREELASQKPYRDWIAEETLSVGDLPEPAGTQVPDTSVPSGTKGSGTTVPPGTQVPDADVPRTFARARLGLHYDDLDEALRPMAENGSVPLASMGFDVPPAVLSNRPRPFYDYFCQLFAQVTNPPIDALRESYVTSDVLYLGNHGNILEDMRDNCRLVRLNGPVVDEDTFERLRHLDQEGFHARTFHGSFAVDPVTGAAEPGALEAALDKLCNDVEEAVRSGVNIVALSDRCPEGQVPLPSLLMVGAVHHHLLRAGIRTLADLIVETGDAVNAHDFAALTGYSASAIWPYMAHEVIAEQSASGVLAVPADQGIATYDKAANSGVLHIMSKMGISTVQGYHSAQIFEAVGLGPEVIDRCFTGTPSRVGGLDFNGIQTELEARYARALDLAKSPAPDQLPSSGMTKWRPQSGLYAGEEHLLDPQAIYLLQTACKSGDFAVFEQYRDHVRRDGRPMMLRDLLELVPLPSGPVPLDEVEPWESIVTRFNTGAMSYGSISQEAHMCLAIAMNRIGGRSNTGEGGEDPAREVPYPNGDSAKSAIKQVASGRFGVTSRYLGSAREIQIKMAQGAKPGEGGHLPGKKVYPWIARVRRSTPGVGLISPPPHHDIYSIEDLAELIFDLQCANPSARVSVKLVAEAGVGTIATGVAKGGAAKILISGSNGGTGVAPRDSIYHAGLPLELGLAEAQQTLLQNGLRSRVVLEADGKLMAGFDVAVAALLGAEEFGFATLPLIAMGCLMQRDCQQDTCPAGICTQNCRLREQFHASPDDVVNFMRFIAEDLRREMARLGFRTVDEMVGRADCLRQREVPGHPKANSVDLSALLAQVRPLYGAAIPGAESARFLRSMAFDAQLERTLDATLFIPYTASAREHLEPVSFHVDLANVNRACGTMLGSVVTQQHPEGLPEDSIKIHCTGSGGQSFGAFLPAGLSMSIEGDANDYFGKGLSGGILAVRPNAAATYKFNENMSVGNVAFYGATGGKGFINGLAGQRFCVRNSGAQVVVEGVGACGCEYMTGGEVVVLGEVGPNFAAGMSGGTAYVLDEFGTLDARVNHGLVDVLPLDERDLERVRGLVEEHVARTQSPLGIKLLYRWNHYKRQFKKVLPRDYARVVAMVASELEAGATREQAEEKAFDAITLGR